MCISNGREAIGGRGDLSSIAKAGTWPRYDQKTTRPLSRYILQGGAVRKESRKTRLTELVLALLPPFSGATVLDRFFAERILHADSLSRENVKTRLDNNRCRAAKLFYPLSRVTNHLENLGCQLSFSRGGKEKKLKISITNPRFFHRDINENIITEEALRGERERKKERRVRWKAGIKINNVSAARFIWSRYYLGRWRGHHSSCTNGSISRDRPISNRWTPQIQNVATWYVPTCFLCISPGPRLYRISEY